MTAAHGAGHDAAVTERLKLSERRDHLVGAALAVAEREGLAAATVRSVAREAGVATGVVHYAFADKDDMLAAMAEQLVRELRTAAAPPAGTDPAELLVAGVRNVWRTLERTAERQALTYEITVVALRQEALHGAAVRQYAASHAAVLDFLDAVATATGREWTEPVDRVAGLVLAVLDGVVLRFLVDRDARAARRGLEAFARLVAGWLGDA